MTNPGTIGRLRRFRLLHSNLSKPITFQLQHHETAAMETRTLGNKRGTYSMLWPIRFQHLRRNRNSTPSTYGSTSSSTTTKDPLQNHSHVHMGKGRRQHQVMQEAQRGNTVPRSHHLISGRHYFPTLLRNSVHSQQCLGSGSFRVSMHQNQQRGSNGETQLGLWPSRSTFQFVVEHSSGIRLITAADFSTTHHF